MPPITPGRSVPLANGFILLTKLFPASMSTPLFLYENSCLFGNKNKFFNILIQ